MLLVSPVDLEEAKECLRAGVDVVDCKNPREGSLGANFPWVLRSMRKLVNQWNQASASTPAQPTAGNPTKLSATIGDVPNLPGTVALAAAGAAGCGVDFVKVGLMGPTSVEGAVELLAAAVRAAKDENPDVLVVAAGYADRRRLDGASVPPTDVSAVAQRAGADVAMLDTAIKDGRSILEFLNPSTLRAFVADARDRGLMAALAGSLKKQDLPTVKEIGPDIVGVRSLACTNQDRNGGRIRAELVAELKEML